MVGSRPGQRDALLEAAFEALLETGTGFGLAEVARRAEASKALVLHHFGTREGLLDAMAARVLAETQQGLARLVDDYPNPRERLDALARTLLEEPRGTPPRHARHVLAFWLLTDEEGGCRGQLRDALLADFVEATRREARLPPRPFAATLLSRWHGATVRFASGQAVDFDAEGEALVAELARLADAAR